jgi:hypothetical protein
MGNFDNVLFKFEKKFSRIIIKISSLIISTVLIFFFTSSFQLSPAQTGVDSVKKRGDLVKSCKINDDDIVWNLKIEQDHLSKRLSELQNRQQQFEKDRDASPSLTSELMGEANELENQGKELNAEIKNLRKRIIKVAQIAEKKYFDKCCGITRYIGNSIIESGDKIYSNANAINGDFIVEGEIKGSLTVINGSLILHNGSKVDGKIILINSDMYAESSAKYSDIGCGEIERYDEPYNEYSEDRQYSYNFSPPPFKIPGTDITNNGEVRYNRVEGLYLGMNVPKKYYWSGKKTYSIYGFGGYGFANHSWGGGINFDTWVGNEFRTEFGIDVHNFIDSKDNWLISPEENSIAAFLIHEDFKDYYRKKGFSIHLAQYLDKNLRLRVDYVSNDYNSVERNTNWSLFRKDIMFRENPMIDSGRIKSVVFSVDHITVYGKDYNPEGWNISSQYEVAKGDYEFNRFSVDVRRYQKVSDDLRINARFVLGSSEKHLPLQRAFELGGLGTIPSVRFKEDIGNRMILGNVELLIRIHEVEDFFPLSIFHGNDLILFYDAGQVENANYEDKVWEGFEKFSFSKIKHDLGAALGFGRGSFRIGATFRLDKSESPRLFLRLSQPF